MRIVGGLVAELGCGSGQPVAPRQSLDRDLGLGSLERVELLLRLEQAFGVLLPDEVMVRADTPGDLIQAICNATPGRPERPLQATPAPSIVEASGVPLTARTLVEALAWHVERSPERTHVFLRQDDGQEQPISYGRLWRRANAVAALLREHGLQAGETVSLMLRTEEAFFSSFFGTLIAGGVPVPIYPPFRLDRLEEYAQRQVGILRNAEARLLITFGEAHGVAGLLRSRVPSLRQVLTADQVEDSDTQSALAGPVGLTTGDPALIQYTSGSTGEPKGVLLTHANLLANIRAIGEAIDIRSDDVAVSWLPLYHDMGLIGTWLAAMYFGLPIALMSPLAFLSRPSRWLWMIHAHHGTVSPAPNFAYELCVRRIADAELEGLDLRSWRMAANGSEAVSPLTMERFAKRFGPYGFRPQAMCPMYGLAESSVALTIPPLGRTPRIERVSRERFQTVREAIPARPDEPMPLHFVSCGRPIPGHEVRVVDRAGKPVGERIEGRIEFRGPSVTSGYYRRPEATQAIMHDGWMDSGDLGFLADGELVITGRQKDMIKRAGRNLYPEEVEEVTGDIPGVRKGCVAAFGVPESTMGTERLVVVAESREGSPELRERLRSAVIDRVVATLGIPPDAVLIAAPGAVRKTSSGKIRRGATRDAYLRGELDQRRSIARQWVKLLASDLAGRASRLGARSVEIGFAVWVGTVLLVAVPLLWLLLIVAPGGRAAERLVKQWCRLLLRMCGIPVRVSGVEALPGLGPAVLVANHQSYLDSVALLAALPIDVRLVFKRELLRAPLLGTVVRKVGHVPVDRVDLSRSVADADVVTATLRAGTSLLVFPEGTFRAAPGLLPFRLGAFKAAVEAGRPVVPVAIVGTREILRGDARLPRWGRIAISVFRPIQPREGAGWPELVRLRDAARSAIAEATGERPLESQPSLE